jgi:hypothetical protein
MGGGPNSTQRNAQKNAGYLTDQVGQAAGRQERFFEGQQAAVSPFYRSRMMNGDPNFNQYTDAASGINARSFAPARQALYARLGSQQGLPSGYREQAMQDLDDRQAHGFDDLLIQGLQRNEAAKQGGAAGMLNQQQLANPGGYFGQALAGNQLMMNTRQKPGGVLGGALSGVGGLLSMASSF